MTFVEHYEMSALQLDELWHYESFLANALLDLPLRKCSAKPSSTWGCAMPPATFLQLKSDVRKMWCRAAQYFMAFKCEGEAGWGLTVRHDLDKKLSLSANLFTILGWLVKAPSPQHCDAGHRYLRSPAGDDLYLGGPISLSQFSENPTMRCQRSLNKPSVFVSTLRPLNPGLEVTWTYFKQVQGVGALYTIREWQQEACCSEMDQVGEEVCDKQHKAQCPRPTKRMRLVTSYLWCTFCGLNLEVSGRVNQKEHWATHHAVQICHDMGVEVDAVDISKGVVPKEFTIRLDLLDNVLQSLRSYKYVIYPACRFFDNMGITVPDDEDVLAQDQCFQKFKMEAKDAFRKYQIIHLKGMHIPETYDDLLPTPKTTYRDVIWLGNVRPRSNQFSVRKELTPAEKDSLDIDVMTEFQNIVVSHCVD